MLCLQKQPGSSPYCPTPAALSSPSPQLLPLEGASRPWTAQVINHGLQVVGEETGHVCVGSWGVKTRQQQDWTLRLLTQTARPIDQTPLKHENNESSASSPESWFQVKILAPNVSCHL